MFDTFEGKKCYNYFYDKNEVCQHCKSIDVIGGKTVRRDWYLSEKNKTYDIISTPLKNSDGSLSKLSIFHDVTQCTKCESQTKLGATNDYQVVAGQNVADITIDEHIILAIRNITGAGDFTIRNANMTLVRIG